MMRKDFIEVNIDPEKVSALLRECAKECILPYFKNLSENDIHRKNDKTKSKVTVADHESEAFLTKALIEILPGSFVVGEEGAYENKDTLEYLQNPEKLIWVIDPVDGTSNFAKGSETFCVMVALVKDGQTQMAWIYDVCNDSMVTAEKGKGAFIDDVPVTIEQIVPSEGAAGFAGNQLADKVQGMTIDTLGCVGHEYIKILKSEAVFALYRVTQPWDHAAGTLIVTEAGGLATKWNGAPYSSKSKEGGIIVANNQETWQKVKNAIPDKVLRKYGIEP